MSYAGSLAFHLLPEVLELLGREEQRQLAAEGFAIPRLAFAERIGVFAGLESADEFRLAPGPVSTPAGAAGATEPDRNRATASAVPARARAVAEKASE